MKKYFIRAVKVLFVLPINFILYMFSSFLLCFWAAKRDIPMCLRGELDGKPIKFYIHGTTIE